MNSDNLQLDFIIFQSKLKIYVEYIVIEASLFVKLGGHISVWVRNPIFLTYVKIGFQLWFPTVGNQTEIISLEIKRIIFDKKNTTHTL